jgi:HSP20 family protein
MPDPDPAIDEGDAHAASHRRKLQGFDAFRGRHESRSFAPAARWLTIDLSETDEAYTLTAELPGVEPKDIEVMLRDNVLILRGVKRDDRDEAEGERVYLERSYGRFERTMPFAAEVDVDRVEASSRNGVLTITLPKNPDADATARRIEVRRAEG